MHEGRQNKGCLPQDLESFPSGDSAQGGALLSTLMILALPSCKSLLLAAMLVVALGRTYFGCHWLLDSISGLVQGMLCSSILRLCGWMRGDGRILFNFVGGAILYVLTGIGEWMSRCWQDTWRCNTTFRPAKVADEERGSERAMTRQDGRGEFCTCEQCRRMEFQLHS